jgi:hypothetical protein
MPMYQPVHVGAGGATGGALSGISAAWALLALIKTAAAKSIFLMTFPDRH